MYEIQLPRVPVHRTLKAYVDGAFIRSESGRTYRVTTVNGPIDVPDASRKDARDAVRGARGASAKWAGSTAYLRGQILHRLGEMLDIASELDEFARALDLPGDHCDAAELVVHYAGFCDKLGQILGSTNAVAGHASYTEPLGVGVSAVYVPDDAGLTDIVEAGVAALAAGNAVIMVAEGRAGALACVLAERLAVSDLPAGVFQVLPTTRDEAVTVLAGATDVRAIDVTRHVRRAELEVMAAESVTRVRERPSNNSDDQARSYRSLTNLRWQIDYRTVVAAVGR